VVSGQWSVVSGQWSLELLQKFNVFVGRIIWAKNYRLTPRYYIQMLRPTRIFAILSISHWSLVKKS